MGPTATFLLGLSMLPVLCHGEAETPDACCLTHNASNCFCSDVMGTGVEDWRIDAGESSAGLGPAAMIAICFGVLLCGCVICVFGTTFIVEREKQAKRKITIV